MIMKDNEYWEQVKLAEEIAREAHKTQFRKFGADKGEPYIVHPERMSANTLDPILKAAAWLHDVVEDTSVTAKDLREKGVDDSIVNIVECVTKKDGEPYVDFIRRICRSGEYPMMLKDLDIRDNLRSLDKGSLRDKYELALLVIELNSRLGEYL